MDSDLNSIYFLPLADTVSGRCWGKTKDSQVPVIPPFPSPSYIFTSKVFPRLHSPQQTPLPSVCPCNEDTGQAVWWEWRCGTERFLSMACWTWMWKKTSSLPWLYKENKVIGQVQRSPFGTCIKPCGMNPTLSESWAQERHLPLVTTLFCAARLFAAASHRWFFILHIFCWEIMQNVVCLMDHREPGMPRK